MSNSLHTYSTIATLLLIPLSANTKPNHHSSHNMTAISSNAPIVKSQQLFHYKSLEQNVIKEICPVMKPVEVINIRITNTDTKYLTNRKRHYKSDSDGNHHVGNHILPHPGNPILHTGHDTQLDIDLKDYMKSLDDYVLLEIELDETGTTFTPGETSVTYGNTDGQKMFCVKELMAKQLNPTKKYLYVKYVYHSATGPAIGAYSISVDTKNGPFSTRVIIDPNVKNEG